jgi:prepilin-type N-terminal cleavage/methylation domain-containing protein
MPRGFTLIELLVVLAILGIVLAIGWPTIRQTRDQLVLREWTTTLVAAHTRARSVAIAEQRVTLVTVTAESLVVRAIVSPTDTAERWRTAGPASEGVSLAGAPHTTAFAPSGVAFGLANVTYSLSRGGLARQVIVSRYGRVRIP